MSFEIISHEFDDLLLNIREYFKDADNEVLFDRRNVIKIVDFNNTKYVVKSFKVPHLINKVVYTFFRETKASKSYFNSVKIFDHVPKPIGYIEFKKLGLLHDSYYISEEFKYDLTIREPLLDSNYSNKDEILKEFAQFTFELHQNNIFHKDYSPGNILIQKKEDDYSFKIVDVNRMVFKELTLDEKLDNFSQLWAKDEDLEIIIREYASLANLDVSLALEKALKYSQNLKDRKNFKKRLKGKKVVD